MGSTYSVGKKAAAMVAPDGTVYYVLYEQTYESNVHPQNPRWCAVHFGTANSCMKKIVSWSTACEGGSLKGKGGDVTPSAYIKHWREAMANPVELKGQVVTAHFGNGLYKIEEDKIDAVNAVLANHGFRGVADNKLTVDFRANPALMSSIIEVTRYPWRFFETHLMSSELAAWAAYSPAACKSEEPKFEVFFVPTERNYDPAHWVRIDGEMHHEGWEYSTIQSMIHRFAVPSEAAAPGSAEWVIKQIRATVKQKRPFSLDQRIKIDPSKIEEDWRKSQFKHLAGKLALSESEVIETTFRKAREVDAEYELCGMPDDAMTFIDLPPAGYPGEQQQLLAA